MLEQKESVTIRDTYFRLAERGDCLGGGGRLLWEQG